MPGTEIASPFVEVPGPIRRFFRVHVDPLPNSEGDNTHQLMVIDLSTRSLEAIPFKNVEAATTPGTFSPVM